MLSTYPENSLVIMQRISIGVCKLDMSRGRHISLMLRLKTVPVNM